MTSNGPSSGSDWVARLLSIFMRKPADTIAERTRRRVTLHLIPWLFFLYILAYLDRVNVSVAELRMTAAPSAGGLGFDKNIIGIGAGIFFWGYVILEIPSTVSVVYWGARWVFVRILVLWGICASLVGLIGTPFANHLFGWLPHVSENAGLLAGAARFINGLHDNPENQFYFFRFMLGFFEGGFFPSVIFYLSQWFRTEDRAKAIASFMAAIPASGVLGMIFGGWILDFHWLGLPGWRWIFIFEGIAPVVAGFVTLFLLPNQPAKAKWLPPDERDWLVAELDREDKSKQGQSHWAWIHHLGMVALLTVVYFCINVTSYGLTMFLPAIIQSQAHVSDVVATFLTATAYLLALAAMLVNSWHSDRTGERPWHVAVPLALSSVGIWLTASLDGVAVWPVLLMILWVGTVLYAHVPPFWPIPTLFLGAAVAASAIGFINCMGNIGGYFGPRVVGKAAMDQPTPARVATTVGLLGSPMGQGPLLATSFYAAGKAAGQISFASGLKKISPWPLVAAVIILIVGYTRRRKFAPNLPSLPAISVPATPEPNSPAGL